MRPPRLATEPDRRIAGWTVYETAEGWSATSRTDPSLTVQHLSFAALARVCEAINRPPVRCIHV